ncbi:MAG: sugar phosphate isomerase/epimerase [Chloroflexi bacterium]|nr:sugar phosphate isomerase/epimerase [Chloroflexota bacterium]
MKIGYAFRRAAFYPFADHNGPGNELPPREVRGAYLRKVRELGFEGIEVGLRSAGNTEAEVRELRRELEGEGVVCAAVRGGGGFASPRALAGSRRRVEQAIHTASWIGSNLVNMTVGVPATDPHGPGRSYGERVSQGGSRTATHADFEITAKHLREAAAIAADLGVEISIEMHQHSLADNAWSCLHLLELVDRPNVGVNPDLGNLYWTYEHPEETIEQCIVALAPKAKYWHCKQLRRVHIPDLGKAFFLKVPLPDGEIDYRFAISAMVDAGYQGYLAVEGVREGDQLYDDGRSVRYCREILRELGQ